LEFDIYKFTQENQERLLNVEFLKKRLVLIGMKKTGKSVVKAILSGDILKSVKIDTE